MFKGIKKFFTREAIENHPQLQRLNKYFHDPALWSLKRESVARGVAAGFFIGFIPIMPFQMFLCVVLAILIRANVVISVASCWIYNPITFLPITYLTSAVGKWILGENDNKIQIIAHEFAWKLGFIHQSSLSSWITEFGKDFLVGVPFVALTAAIVGYLLVIIFWYVYKFLKK